MIQFRQRDTAYLCAAKVEPDSSGLMAALVSKAAKLVVSSNTSYSAASCLLAESTSPASSLISWSRRSSFLSKSSSSSKLVTREVRISSTESSKRMGTTISPVNEGREVIMKKPIPPGGLQGLH